MPLTFHCAHASEISAETLYRILQLRLDVFVVEQEAPYSDIDGRDLEPGAELMWAEEGGEVVATLRLLDDRDVTAPTHQHHPDDPEAMRIGRVATSAGARGRGIAGTLMSRAVARCDERRPGVASVLDAQEHLAPWYARYGYDVCGPRFVEDDILHVPMRRVGQ